MVVLALISFRLYWKVWENLRESIPVLVHYPWAPKLKKNGVTETKKCIRFTHNFLQICEWHLNYKSASSQSNLICSSYVNCEAWVLATPVSYPLGCRLPNHHMREITGDMRSPLWQHRLHWWDYPRYYQCSTPNLISWWSTIKCWWLVWTSYSQKKLMVQIT